MFVLRGSVFSGLAVLGLAVFGFCFIVFSGLAVFGLSVFWVLCVKGQSVLVYFVLVMILE